ncbi:Ornithine carbamoyltransferase [Desulfobacca acetoxidans DSM 11109]|uniref:Ornithine carbamoyltransferase n=2 Tax=Desulfobacca acetoxidans TaxID=60893 RepID=F2NDM3_DESAR|nr:Ornithine carbamoyltransferase [Desulfobacca acetoxidans DSM 11109]
MHGGRVTRPLQNANNTMNRDLLTILDLTAAEIYQLLERAAALKVLHQQDHDPKPLAGKTLALIFEKPSTRTRVSFEAGIAHLGGSTIYLGRNDSQLSRSEPIADTARVLARYVDGIVIRTFGHDIVEDMARWADIPVINGLTDSHHPCQVLSDLQTIQERFGRVTDLKVAWIGDGNNMANSWITAALRLDFSLSLACPPGYEPDAGLLQQARQEGRPIYLQDDPVRAVQEAHVINTDVWASMGQEAEAKARKKVFAPYQVNGALLQHARPDAIILHCLPAHRGEEITGEVLDGPQSAAWDQAENRLHLQKALLEWLIGWDTP